MVSLDNVAVEAGSLIDTQHTGDATDNAPDRAPNDGTYRPGSAFSLAGPTFYTAGHTLSVVRGGDNDCRGEQSRHQDTTFFHLTLLVGLHVHDKATRRWLFPLVLFRQPIGLTEPGANLGRV